MKYGDLPMNFGSFKVDCNEMMFYQYLPIKFKDSINIFYEDRLMPFRQLINTCVQDFIVDFGIVNFTKTYIYLTAKRMYQTDNCTFNRGGYHSDGFMTKDINYIWSDNNGTVFNHSKFNLTLDDSIAMTEMEQQAKHENEISYQDGSLLRLDEYNIHKVKENQTPGMRTFLKLSFSEDKYNLIGNSHNYLFDYNWEMKPRKVERNIPQN